MAKIVEHQSRDVDDQAQALDGWQQRYEQLSAGRFEGRAWQLVMDEGTLLREHTNRHLREQITPPPDHLVLAIPLAVMPGSSFGGRPLERESLMVFGPDEEYDLVSAGELDLIGLSVHRDTLAGLAPPKWNGWSGPSANAIWASPRKRPVPFGRCCWRSRARPRKRAP
ncbi:hypothetical protein [Ideonella paludis]|uniref:hypothetical protein n=1 Tax=Ideonella paludis TaxID=1233411 RepID=UPI00363ED1D6